MTDKPVETPKDELCICGVKHADPIHSKEWCFGGIEGAHEFTKPVEIQETTMPDLLPCPFCGSEAYFTKSVNGSRMIYAGCGPCGIAQKAQLIYSPAGDTPTKDVVAAWNKRAVSPSLESRWINVAERLPGVGDWVIVTIGGYVQRMACRLSTLIPDQRVWDWADYDVDSAPFEVVTHWMELPRAELETEDY